MSVSCGKGYNLLFFFYIPRVMLCDSISEDRNRKQDDNLDRYIFRRYNSLILIYVSMNEPSNRPLEKNTFVVSIHGVRRFEAHASKYSWIHLRIVIFESTPKFNIQSKSENRHLKHHQVQQQKCKITHMHCMMNTRVMKVIISEQWDIFGVLFFTYGRV